MADDLGDGDGRGPEPRPDCVQSEELEHEGCRERKQDEDHERLADRAALPDPFEEPLPLFEIRTDSFLCAGLELGAAPRRRSAG